MACEFLLLLLFFLFVLLLLFWFFCFCLRREASHVPHSLTCLYYSYCSYSSYFLGDRFLSSAGAGGNCARPMRLPDPSPVLDKNCAPMGPEILSSTGARVWRKAPMVFPHSSSVLDKFQSAIFSLINVTLIDLICYS